ncbi:MAG: DUF1653 domain-containing protein, partial [Candidatus Roizmanbacteria bacterium]
MQTKHPHFQIGMYQHYKGDLYEVIGVARHSETLEELVVYKGKYYNPEFGNNPISYILFRNAPPTFLDFNSL